MKEKTRKRIFLWFRIAIALGAIVYIVLKFDLGGAWAELTNPYPNLYYVALALAAFLVFMGFLAIRWFILSKARKHPYGFFYLYRSVIIHMLFNNVLPTTIGGDVYRIMDTGGHEGKGVAFSIVWTDRMVGFIGVFGFGFLASIVYTVISGNFLFLAIFGGMFLIAISLTLAFLSKKINDWFSPGLSKLRIFKYPLGEKIAGAFKSITHYRKHKGALVAGLFVSLGVQVSIVAIWFCLFLALSEKKDEEVLPVQEAGEVVAERVQITTVLQGDNLNVRDSFQISSVAENTSGASDASLVDSVVRYSIERQEGPNFIHFMVTIPVINTAAMFSVGGWGMREATFVNVLASLSVETSEDKFLATALLFDAVNVFFSLLGGVFLLFRRGRKKGLPKGKNSQQSVVSTESR